MRFAAAVSLLALVSSSASAQTPFEVACVIRNLNGTWQILNDSGHRPIGCASIAASATTVTVMFDFVAVKVNSLVVAPDETFAVQGVLAGASVGFDRAVIQFGKGGARVLPPALNVPGGNFFVYGRFER